MRPRSSVRRAKPATTSSGAHDAYTELLSAHQDAAEHGRPLLTQSGEAHVRRQLELTTPADEAATSKPQAQETHRRERK